MVACTEQIEHNFTPFKTLWRDRVTSFCELASELWHMFYLSAFVTRTGFLLQYCLMNCDPSWPEPAPASQGAQWDILRSSLIIEEHKQVFSCSRHIHSPKDQLNFVLCNFEEKLSFNYNCVTPWLGGCRPQWQGLWETDSTVSFLWFYFVLEYLFEERF